MLLSFGRWPLDEPIRITGGFGADYGTYLHRGIDMGVQTGVAVYAPGDGVVYNFPDQAGGFGTAVVIQHPVEDWPYSIYAHLSSKVVRAGDVVKVGQLIGYSGNTGQSSGPHLHWQVCKVPWFPTDISQSADPASFVVAGGGNLIEDEEDELSQADKQRIAVLENIVAANGINVQVSDDPQYGNRALLIQLGKCDEKTPEGTNILITGPDAITYLNARGVSIMESVTSLETVVEKQGEDFKQGLPAHHHPNQPTGSAIAD